MFQVRGRCFPSWPLNLYAPFPSDSVTSYGPSHLGPSFHVSSARLASLLRYTRSPASRIAAFSLLSSKRSRLICKASLFYTWSTSAVLIVGMPISARMTTSIPYVNENGVSPLLDFIIVRCAHRDMREFFHRVLASCF
ncbi:hypothetical protein Tco_1159883 [Tanacetum coccineum]